MKTFGIAMILLAGALLGFAEEDPHVWTVETAPPVVLRTVPEAGATDVEPGRAELRVTFNKEMLDGTWSWTKVNNGSFPEVADKPRYEAGGKTCVLPVKLEPNETYVIWLNSDRFRGFKDRGNRAAVPYLLVFKTREGTIRKTRGG